MDSNSMAFSVETRQPFMDYRIVEFLNALPDKYKMYKGWTKYISRIAFDKKLPDKINWRRKKVGWLMPLKEWVSKDTRIAMDNYIINSSFTKDVLSSSHYNGFLNNLIPETLNGLPLRFYLRVYNVARHGSIFFGCK
jgi:asparagine synthase (glutamine-hydrolysing)